jgi:hypothetical protein
LNGRICLGCAVRSAAAPGTPTSTGGVDTGVCFAAIYDESTVMTTEIARERVTDTKLLVTLTSTG